MSKVKILVVEDEANVAKSIQGILEDKGYSVPDVVDSGEEAIEKAGETCPDLVLMDIILKGAMDGIEAAKHIHDRFNIPVIYLTGYADEEKLQKAKLTEPYGYILKPFNAQELYATIEMALYKYKLENELRSRFSTVLRSIGDAVITIDKKGFITFMNPVAEALTGWKKEVAQGKALIKVFDVKDKDKIISIKSSSMKALFRGNIDSLTNESILISDGKKEIPIEFNVAAIRDDKGIISGFVLVFRDITERKRAEEETQKMHQGLIEAHEKLQRAYEEEKQLRDKLIQSEKLASLGLMGAKIAHEINNPLTIISGRAQLFLTMDIGEELRKAFTLIKQESMRIKNITSTYMNLSKPTPPKKEKVNLNEVVEETLDSLTITGEIKCYKIQKNLKPDLPEVIGDYDRLVQVFRDLIVNASHAMADSEEKILTFQSSISKDGKFAEVSVHDTGSGIEKEKLDNIFEVYYTTKPDGLGTGLGLVVVKYIVEKQHKGKVLVESEVGKGTTFTVQLPLKIERKRKRILVVDDEEFIRELFVTFLEECGMEVFEACNGREALENFEKIQPDIILSDIQMPVMNGFELAEKVRAKNPEQKIIFMTGYYFKRDIQSKIEKSNIRYFTKPANIDVVWEMISKELKSETP